jgi:hypothetical protein
MKVTSDSCMTPPAEVSFHRYKERVSNYVQTQSVNMDYSTLLIVLALSSAAVKGLQPNYSPGNSILITIEYINFIIIII